MFVCVCMCLLVCVCTLFGPTVKTKGKAWQLGPLHQHCLDRCLLYLFKLVCKGHGAYSVGLDEE